MLGAADVIGVPPALDVEVSMLWHLGRSMLVYGTRLISNEDLLGLSQGNIASSATLEMIAQRLIKSTVSFISRRGGTGGSYVVLHAEQAVYLH